MTESKNKKPAAKKPAVKKPAAKKPAAESPEGPKLVTPLAQDAFRMVLAIIDKADVKGSEAGNIILLKQELARVAGVQTQAPAK